MYDSDNDGRWLYVVCLTGVEVRDSGFVVIQDSEVTNSGSQGLVAHAGALGYIARRSISLTTHYQYHQRIVKAGIFTGPTDAVLSPSELCQSTELQFTQIYLF